jgi:hypothetical protein
MYTFRLRVLFLPLLVFGTILTACTGAHLPTHPVWEEIPITAIQQVAGKWEGVTWAEPRTPRQDDWVRVQISEKGKFEFSSQRMIGTWLGNGNLILEKGKLVSLSKPDMGNATFTLYESNGKHMLKIQGKTKNGRRQEAKLNPAKP